MQQNHIQIRFAQDSDLDQIDRIEQSCFEGDKLSHRSFRDLLLRGNCSFFVAETSHAVIGYAITLYRKGSRLARLYSIAVSNSYRGCGVAGRLLDAAEHEAQSRECTAIYLEVRLDNHQALGLYQGRGYRRFGIKQDYYQDGEAADCLKKTLTTLYDHAREESSSSGQRGLAPKIKSSL